MRYKRILAALFLPIILLLITTSCTYAASNEETSSQSGESLDGYFAKISYLNYTSYGTGHYLAFTLTYDHTYYQKKKSSLSELLNGLKESFEKNGYSVSIDTYSGSFIAEMVFDTTEQYYKAIGYDGFSTDSTEPDKVEKTAFYITSSFSSKTIFSDVTKDYKYVGRLLSDGCTKAGIANEYVLLRYVYGTPYSQKTITSDCDKISYDAEKKLYLHEFLMNVDTCDRTIEITQRIPNTTTWYVLSIVAGIIVFAIPMVIIIVKKSKRSK